MKATRMIAVLLVTLSLVGCANLNAVRDYADESAQLSAYTELTTRFRDTYQREQPYLFGEAERLAQDNNKKRQAAYDDLLKIHQTVTLYMQTLAQLAGDDTFDLSHEIDALSGVIKMHPELGINAQHVDAATNIAKVVTKWITSSYQKQAVRKMIEEGDPHLQKILDAMVTLVRYYRKTNENEQKTVLGFFETEIPFADPSQDKLLVALARAQLQAKTNEYRNAQLKYDEAEKGIKSIAEGHKKLLVNINKLSSDEVKAMISSLTIDIKTIRANLQAVRN